MSKMNEGMLDAIQAVMDSNNPWELTAEESRLLRMAQNGNDGALCELLASLGMTSDERCTGFYAGVHVGEDVTEN